MSHAIFTPGQAGWLEDLDRVIAELKPDSWKGYTIDDNTHKDLSRYPWRMDDDQVTYKGYEKMVASGIRNVCVHKGLFPPSAEIKWPRLLDYAKVDDVAQAAKDWPRLNFIIYHAGYHHVGGSPEAALESFERTGRIEWVSDLAEISGRYGVANVYADLGATFASAAVTHPRLGAAILGILIRGLGADHVVWGTDSVWWGSPQWQIEAFRRLEMPDDLLLPRYGFAPLGPADGATKRAILGENSARLYGLEPKTAQVQMAADHITALKAEYQASGPLPAHRAYGYARV